MKAVNLRHGGRRRETKLALIIAFASLSRALLAPARGPGAPIVAGLASRGLNLNGTSTLEPKISYFLCYRRVVEF